MSSEDRSAALLTERQRQFLQGETDLSGRGERAARTRIRKRLSACLRDISLLLYSEKFDIEDIQRAVPDDSPSVDDIEELTAPNLGGYADDLVALAVIVEEFSPDQQSSFRDDAGPENEPAATIDMGLRKAARKLGRTLERCDITVEWGGPLDDLAEQDLEELTDDELLQLLMAGRIGQKEYLMVVIDRHVEDAVGTLETDE